MKDPLRRRSALLGKLEKHTDFVRGSVSSVCAKCSRARCICEKKTSRRAYRLTYKDSQQKTQIVYVPRRRLPEIRKMIANHARLRKILAQLLEANIEIFKKGTGS
ncbi:MAG: hypothetical protein HQ592_05980 [Planctomycetes bacterium]|nr:hypothetical protein [Planctomycetota bacterium]